MEKIMIVMIPEDSDIELFGKAIESVGGRILLERELDVSKEVELNSGRIKRIAFLGIPTMFGSFSHHYRPALCAGLDSVGTIKSFGEDFSDLKLNPSEFLESITLLERGMCIEQVEQVELFPIVDFKNKETILFLQNYGHTLKKKECFSGIFCRKHLRQKIF